MKKMAIAVVFLAVMFLTINVAYANPVMFFYLPNQPITTPPNITIQSPAKGIVQNSSVTLFNFTVTKPSSWFSNQSADDWPTSVVSAPYYSLVKVESWYYELDGVKGQTQSVNDLQSVMPTPQETFNFSTALTLAEGFHNLTVIVQSQSFYRDYGSLIGDPVYSTQLAGRSDTVNFTVDYVMPTISFLQSDQNRTFNTGNVTLNLVTNKPVSQMVYNLDNNDNMTTDATTTLSILNLSNGEHNLTAYAKDEYGVISGPSMISFNVKTPQPSTVFPIMAVALIAAAIAIASVWLLSYRRKSKSRNFDLIDEIS